MQELDRKFLMSLLKTILVCIGMSCIVWIGLMCLPAIIRVCVGRATGIALLVPRILRGLPRAVQIPATLLGPPLLVGSLGGYLWYLVSHR
jgi:hypothetical protein